MARARNIKPGFFENEDLPEVPPMGRLLFIGLWLLADREGRLEYRPKRIKGKLFPYEECDVDSYCCQLEQLNFLKRYEISGTQYIQIVKFKEHQKPHPNEKASEIPAPPNITSDREKVESTQADSLNDDCLNDDSRKAASPRKRDEIFEAVAEVSNLSLDGLTDSERGRCNKAAKELKKVDATPDEIRRRAKIYRETWPGIDLTPNALAANWSRMKAGGKDEFDAMSYDL